MTSSKARPPVRGVGPERDQGQPDVLVEVGVQEQHLVLADRTVVIEDHLAMPEPPHHLREVLHLRRRDGGDAEGVYIAATPRPMPSVKRPPERRCMVVAHDPVISGWRVL